MHDQGSPEEIIIIGGGITGVSIAYYLSQFGFKSTIIESHPDGIAQCASGKAGGFLAKDWSGTEFASESFDLHQELASKYNGPENWLYRRVNTYSGAVSTKGKAAPLMNWADGIRKVEKIGGPETTAQIHPGLFCRYLITKTQSTVILGTVTGLKFSTSSNRVAVTGVKVHNLQNTSEPNITLPASKIILATGPWTSHLASKWGLSNVPHIGYVKAHSIIFNPQPPFYSPDCIFATIGPKDVEIYPRSDGTIYVCGETRYIEPLPKNSADVQVSEGATETLVGSACRVSKLLTEDTVVQRQACYLPTVEEGDDGNAVIGKVKGYENVWIATGNNCWGILLGPATGLVVAEMVLGKPTSIDVSAYDPARFY
ncbi:hypothetical protein HDV05_000964 [Chytridiales sp. JEL 0842]|nr:hypothetical protein HDV05_000964 [Chytridiales sp. JEL 0842]